jgi:hypothetical protein
MIASLVIFLLATVLLISLKADVWHYLVLALLLIAAHILGSIGNNPDNQEDDL